MKKIILSQLYELKKNRVVFMFCFGVLIICTTLLFMTNQWTETQTISETIASYGLYMLSVFARASIMVISGFICAGDFPDRTIYNEISSGTLRREAFGGRALLAASVSVITAIATLLLPIAAGSLIFGWGDTVTVGSALKRVFLLSLPYFKLSCFAIMISFIFKQPYAAFLAVILVGFSGAFSQKFSSAAIYLVSDFNAGKLCAYSNYTTYGLNTEARFVYDQSVDPKLILMTVVFSLVGGALYLLIGYHYFKKDDLN